MAERRVNKKAPVEKQSTMSVEEVLEKISDSTDEIKEAGVSSSVREKTNERISNDEEIPCKSLTFGGLTWVSPKTNAFYRWNGIGDIEYIPFGELVTMNNTSRGFLFKPLIVVQDPRVVKYFRLLPTYEKVARINDLPKVFKGSLREISKFIDDALNVNMRNVMISKVRQMRKEGLLVNIDVINLLNEKLGYDFSESDLEEE